jgi:integrase
MPAAAAAPANTSSPPSLSLPARRVRRAHRLDRESGPQGGQTAPAAQHPSGPARRPTREIHQAAASTGDDPALDTLLLRLHIETACRHGGALALRPQDLDPQQCLIFLREKAETVRWQPVSPTLMNHLRQHTA